MLWSRNDLRLSHRKQVNDPSNMKLATSLMNFEYKPCGVFEGFEHHQDNESIVPTTLEDTVGLGYIIDKLVSSNFICTVSSVLVIFDTGDTYSCYSNKGDLLKLENKKPPRNLKSIENSIEIYGFGIVKYSVRSEVDV